LQTGGDKRPVFANTKAISAQRQQPKTTQLPLSKLRTTRFLLGCLTFPRTFIYHIVCVLPLLKDHHAPGATSNSVPRGQGLNPSISAAAFLNAHQGLSISVAILANFTNLPNPYLSRL
jgi:hypothetical protein